MTLRRLFAPEGKDNLPIPLKLRGVNSCHCSPEKLNMTIYSTTSWRCIAYSKNMCFFFHCYISSQVCRFQGGFSCPPFLVLKIRPPQPRTHLCPPTVSVQPLMASPGGSQIMGETQIAIPIPIPWDDCIWSFLKCWHPTSMGFPTKNHEFLRCFGGCHHLRKHPYLPAF